MVNLDRARLQLDDLAVPRQIIGALALDLDRRILRRGLLDHAGKLRQQVPNRRGGGPDVAGLGNATLGIVGIPFLAPAHREAIALAAVHHERNRLGGFAERDRQAAGGERVERAGGGGGPGPGSRPPGGGGARGPAGPARLAWNSRFTTATAWVEVMPIGLSSTTQPWTSRLSRRGWLFCRGCLPARGRVWSRCASVEITSAARSESPIGGSITLLAMVTVIRSLFRILRVLRIWRIFLRIGC